MVRFTPRNPVGDRLRDGHQEALDRWEFFNSYVRPVVEDIDSYLFLGWFRISPLVRQLNLLGRLCYRLENVVAEFDAAYEGGFAQLDQGNRVIVEAEHGKAAQLRDAYKELYHAWTDRVKIVSR
jgi:hypothetical protein